MKKCMRSRAPEGTATMTDASGPREPDRDLYEVLGVARDASRDEIALAWRRRAREAHPDARHGDAAAPERFRAVAEAWQVLGDPGRRADYDRGLAPGRRPPGGVRVTVRHSPPSPGPGAAPAGASGPPLVAGPVRVEGGPGPVPWPDGWDEEDVRLALLAELVLRYRGRGWGRRW
jgi:curved DNA-binding protein CbpA